MFSCQAISAFARRFRTDEKGNVALLTGLLAVPLVGAVGFGIDYTRAVSYRIQLDAAANAATLAAIDTARALMAANPNLTEADVKAAAAAKAQQVFAARAPSQYTPIISSDFGVTRVGQTMNANGSYTATMPTVFTGLVGVNQMDLAGTSAANGSLAPAGSSDPSVVINDTVSTPPPQFLTADPSTTNIHVSEYNGWKASKVIEIGKVAAYGVPPPPSGAAFAMELDGVQNGSASKKVYLQSGAYELRYAYIERTSYSDYAPAWLCGTRTSDVDWATSPEGTWGYQSNRMAFYLDRAPNDTPPVNLSAATNNLIDVCIISGAKWVERSVKITINTPGYFWLTMQAEGASDQTGGLISDIRLCRNACAGTPAESYPWAANTVLFSDDFSTPVGNNQLWTERTLDDSGVNSGWSKLATGWTTWPVNQTDFTRATIDGETANRIELDGSYVDNVSAGPGEPSSNRSISRRFMLTPGYYAVRYKYLAARPLASAATELCGLESHSNNLTIAGTTSFAMRVFVDADQSFSHPESEPVIRAQAVWKNPDGSAATLPRLAATVIDACAFSKTTMTRVVQFKIVKPGFYWLTMAGEGTADQWGARLWDVSMTAVGGLSMASPPASAVSIPAPGLAPGTTVVLNSLQVASN
jgi:Flp pilus assembly protein TadG